MAKTLAGRVALVTGASSGIGEAAALALAEAGAYVALAARREDRLTALAARIESASSKALILPGDVADETIATAAVQRTIDQFGKIDILINAAGIIQASTIVNADTAEYRRVMELNLMAAIYTCKAAIGPMLAQRSGHIINISSMSARKTVPVFSSYMVSKHALNAMTDGLRQEVGDKGVKVSILMPGATETEVAANVTDPATRKMMQSHVTREGVMSPADIAETIVFMVLLPPRANISEIAIRPTSDISA